ncbi:helix-turn-helix domain-containing protein [Streptococcus fryi]
MKKVVSLLKETPALFQEALKFHRKRKDCPQDILAEAIRIDVQTYRQYEKDEEKIPSLSRLVAIAVTLKLFPNLSEDLVTKAGYMTPLLSFILMPLTVGHEGVKF